MVGKLGVIRNASAYVKKQERERRECREPQEPGRHGPDS
jgi:hypothetical protein